MKYLYRILEILIIEYLPSKQNARYALGNLLLIIIDNNAPLIIYLYVHAVPSLFARSIIAVSISP